LLRGAAASGTVLGFAPAVGRLAFANGDVRGLLVIVHLRGGCDGLNLISPANDPDFVAPASPNSASPQTVRMPVSRSPTAPIRTSISDCRRRVDFRSSRCRWDS